MWGQDAGLHPAISASICLTHRRNGSMIKEPMHRRNIGVMKSSLLTHVYCTLTHVDRFTVWSCENGIPLTKQWSAPIWSCIRYFSSIINSKQYVHKESCICSSSALSSTVHFSACLTKEQSLYERPWCSCSRLVFHRGHWACVTGPGTLWHCAWWKRWEVIRNSKQKKKKKQSPADHEPKSTKCPSLHRGDVTQSWVIITLWVSP